MKSYTIFVPLAVIIGCSSSTEGSAECFPGDIQECFASDNCEAVQACAEDGSGFGECRCLDSSTKPNGSGGSVASIDNDAGSNSETDALNFSTGGNNLEESKDAGFVRECSQEWNSTLCITYGVKLDGIGRSWLTTCNNTPGVLPVDDFPPYEDCMYASGASQENIWCCKS